MSTSLWITRLVPDPRHRDARRDLRSAVALHHRVMSLFPDGMGTQARTQAGVLFRTEELPTGGQAILVQSSIAPDSTRLPEGYGRAETKPLGPLLAQLRAGSTVHYRLIANATRKLGANTENGQPRQVKPLHGPEAEEWWHRQARRSGLDVLSVRSTALADASGRRRTDDHYVTHARTRFDGLATVTDPDALRTATAAGIGRGKSYGCGLLSTLPAR